VVGEGDSAHRRKRRYRLLSERGGLRYDLAASIPSTAARASQWSGCDRSILRSTQPIDGDRGYLKGGSEAACRRFRRQPQWSLCGWRRDRHPERRGAITGSARWEGGSVGTTLSFCGDVAIRRSPCSRVRYMTGTRCRG